LAKILEVKAGAIVNEFEGISFFILADVDENVGCLNV